VAAPSYTYITTESCLTSAGIKRVDPSNYPEGTGTRVLYNTSLSAKSISLSAGLYGMVTNINTNNIDSNNEFKQYSVVHILSSMTIYNDSWQMGDAWTFLWLSPVAGTSDSYSNCAIVMSIFNAIVVDSRTSIYKID
jgi:hypothetical protein